MSDTDRHVREQQAALEATTAIRQAIDTVVDGFDAGDVQAAKVRHRLELSLTVLGRLHDRAQRGLSNAKEATP